MARSIYFAPGSGVSKFKPDIIKRPFPTTNSESMVKLNDIKNKNYRTVPDILLQSKGLSRVELAQKMGCDNTTVSRTVRPLLERGIIVHEKNEQDHGRPRITLELNAR